MRLSPCPPWSGLRIIPHCHVWLWVPEQARVRGRAARRPQDAQEPLPQQALPAARQGVALRHIQVSPVLFHVRDAGMYLCRSTIQDWTLEMELFCKTCRRCLSDLIMTSPKQHSEYFHFRSSIRNRRDGAGLSTGNGITPGLGPIKPKVAPKS